MSLNLDAARHFSQTILQYYDQKFTTPPLEEEELEKDEEGHVDPLAEKTQEYNRIANMTDWYQTAHVFEPFTNNAPQERLKQGVLETSALQFSALDRLTAIKENSWDRNEEDPYMLTELVRSNAAFQQVSSYLPLPVLSFSSPKSELDSLIFEKTYCALADRERAQVVQSMEQACQNLKPHFFNSQQRIYRIQGIATFIFRNSLFKGLVCTGLIAGSIILILFVVTPKIHEVVTKALTLRWGAIVDQNPHKFMVRWPNRAYHRAQAFNEFTTKPAWRAQATSYVAPRLISLTKNISSYAPPALTTVYYVVYPKTFFNVCANLFISYFLLKPSLVAFKILNGTEYKTVQALKEKFKKDSLACANALKAHALWMHLQKRGTPEATLGLLGYFSTPAA